jgi:hypothetical protein
LRFRLLALIGIALSLYLISIAEGGGWSRILEWQEAHGLSMAQIYEYGVAAQRWVAGLQIDTQWRALTADLQRRAEETLPVVKQTLSSFRVD